MKQKAYFIVSEGLSFGQKIKYSGLIVDDVKSRFKMSVSFDIFLILLIRDCYRVFSPLLGRRIVTNWLALEITKNLTRWKVSKYGVFSGPYFPVFSPNTGIYGPEKTPYLDTFQTVPRLTKGEWEQSDLFRFAWWWRQNLATILRFFFFSFF